MEFYSVKMTSYAVILLLILHSVTAKNNGHRPLKKQPAKNYLKNNTHDNTAGETRSVSSGTSLKDALPIFGAELDESLGEIFDLEKLTVSNHRGSTFNVDGPENERIRVGNIINLPSGINLRGERTFSTELEKNVLTIKNPAAFTINVDRISLNVQVNDLEIKISEYFQECNLKLRAQSWTGENINTLLNSWGFNNKETYINTAALTPQFKQSFNRDFTNFDLFDTAQLIYIRIGTDNNIHIAFIPYEDAQYQMFVCTNLGTGNVTEKGCALVKELFNDDNRFTNWVNEYTEGVVLSGFNFKYTPGSTIQSSKSIISYHDTKNTKAMEWLAFEKSNNKKYPMEINGGNDYYVVQFNVVTDVNSQQKTYGDKFGGISSDTYKNVFLSGKLYTDRLEMTFMPRITTSTGTFSRLFTGRAIEPFLRTGQQFSAAEANVEKITFKNDSSMCIALSFDAPVTLSDSFTTHNVQYELKNSVVEICQTGSQSLTVKTIRNEEETFHSKAFMNIAYDHGPRKLIYSGELMIVSSDKLFEELSVSFIPSDRVSQFQHITRFPISNLNHIYERGMSFIKFRGNAIFYNLDFEMEVIYKFSFDSAGLCLERNINRDEQTLKSSKRQEDTDEAPQTDFNVESGTRKPISFLNLTRFIVKNKELEFTPLVKFVDTKIAFIPEPRFYDRVDANNMCVDMMNNIDKRRLRAPQPFIFIAVGKADYSCTDGLKEENDLCLFIKRALGMERNQQYSNKMFYGFLNDIREEGIVTANYERNVEFFKIHDGFKLRDFEQTMGYLREPANSEELPPSLPDKGGPPFEGNQFRGKIAMPGLPADDFSSFAPIFGYLQISGKFLHLSIPEVDIQRQPVDLLEHQYVKTKVIFAERQRIELVDDPKIVFKGTVSIGGINQPIDIGGTGAIVEQHFYGDKRKNKLVACLPTDTPARSLGSVARTFDIDLTQDIFDIDVTNICFTYHQEDEKWNVTSANVLADKGLWLHGKTRVEGTNKLGVREEFNVDVQLRCDPSNKQVKLGRPPMYFYPIERTQTPNQEELFDALEDNEEAIYKVVITRRKEAKDLGPFLVIDVGERGMLTATLKGYITTVAFESEITFSVSTSDYESVQFLRDPIEEAKKREGAGEPDKRAMLSAGFECKGNLGTKLFQFRFTGNGLVDLIKANYSLLVERAQNYFNARDEEHREIQEEITRASSGPLKKASKKDELATMYNDIQAMKINFQNEDLNKRSSCRYCKSVKAPGFVWNSCHISDRLGKVSCLQFKKDALKSCDVQCLARCDISKVDAEESSKGMQEELFRRTAQLEKRSRTTELFDDLRTKLRANEGAITNALTEYRESLRDVTSIQKVLPIINIRTDWVDFSNFKKYDSLDFTLVFPPRGRQVENEQIVRTIVVDGFLPVRVAEYFFNRDHVENVNRTIDLEKAVQESYGVSLEIVKSWEIRNQGELMRQRRRRRPVQKKKTSKRAYDYIRINERPTSLVATNGISMNLLLKKHAPWNILRKSNPFVMANTSSTVNKARRSKVSKSASFCRNRRNRIRDYKDMIKYMTSWSDSFDQAKTFLQNSETDIANGLNTLDAELLHKRSLKNRTMSKKRENIGKKWINRMKSGFSTWENEFNHQLSSYHSIAPKLMWNEMNAIFTPAEFDSLQSYLRSTPSSALARSIAPDPPIQQIGESFLNGFASMKTLDDNRKLINQMASMVQQAEQSSQSCHDEL